MTINKKATETVPKPKQARPEFEEKSIPKEIYDLVPHVVEDFCRLRRRLKRKRTANDRLWNSAKRQKKKHTKQIKDPYKRRIEIELFDKTSTHLDKIALPSERHLSSLQTDFKDFSKERKNTINKLLVKKKEASTNKSSLPSQSPLKGQQTPKTSNRTKVNGQGQDQKMTKYISSIKTPGYVKRSLGKTNDFALQNLKKNVFRQNDFLRITQLKQKENISKEVFTRLATPKSIDVPASTPSWKLTKSMLNYKPSSRLMEMAQPKLKLSLSLPSLSEILKVKKAALHYKASNRILELALPTSLPEKKSRGPYHVPEKALRAKISERVTELANPKNRFDRTIRKHPFKVPRRALYAKASKHIKELAQPKFVLSKQKIWKHSI